jgi:hypothetical protein
VPALFHAPELSPATSSADSKTVMDHCGATIPSSAARVALMMPPPTRTTSGLALSGTALSGTALSVTAPGEDDTVLLLPSDRRPAAPGPAGTASPSIVGRNLAKHEVSAV